MIKTLVISALWLVWLLGGEARAQLFVEEGKVVLAVSAGERVNKSLILHNTTAENVEVKVYWEDFVYNSPYDGTKTFMAAGTGPASANGWVSYSPSTFTLPPFGTQKVDYTISVPAQLESGHYGVLFFEKADPIKTDAGINIVTRVGTLFFLEPKTKVKKAVLGDFKIQTDGISGSFVNQGNVIIIPRITYYIMQQGQLVVDRGELKKLYVPPAASAPWKIPFPKRLPAGQYTLVVNADLDEGDVAVKEIGFRKEVSGQLTINSIRD